MADKVTAPGLIRLKAKGQKIVSVTAYDVVSAAIAEEAGADFILVGDSLGNVILGLETTIPVELEDIEHHVRAARAGCRRALLVADLPFGSYQASVEQAVSSAVRLMKAGAEAVKLEGPYLDEIRAIVKAGIPVMGHLGMTPQSVNVFGGFRVQGKGEDDAERIKREALDLQEAGVFGMVLELIPGALAGEISRSLTVPTIGIGAGPECDGQIQVLHDVLGLNTGEFRHAKRYVDGRGLFLQGLTSYADEVRAGTFPTQDNTF
jgi:3-methyl-2-oxobutanoate hydroxymethyltransferase